MAKRKDSKRKALRKGESQRKDGMYVYRVMIDGKSRTLYSSSLEELRKKEDELLNKIEVGIDMDKQRTTLNELADIYLADKEKSVQETTFQTMTSYYNRYVRDDLGNRLLVDLKRSTIKRYYLDLISGKERIKVATLARLNSILKPMLDMAVKDDILIKNPADGVMGEIRNETKSRAKKVGSLTEEQQKEFIKCVLNMDNHRFVRNILIVLIGTGARVGEIIGLRWDDVNFKNNTIDINHAVGYIKRDGKYTHIVKDTKSTAGNRSIPMLEEVRDALLEQKKINEILGFAQPVVDGYTNFVFISERGTIFTRENIATQIKQIVKEYNSTHDDFKLPQFTTHQLRHTFATLLCKNTNDLKAAQKILGHSDFSITMNIYADATDDGVTDTMKAMDGVIFEKKEEKSEEGKENNGKVLKFPKVM